MQKSQLMALSCVCFLFGIYACPAVTPPTKEPRTEQSLPTEPQAQREARDEQPAARDNATDDAIEPSQELRADEPDTPLGPDIRDEPAQRGETGREASVVADAAVEPSREPQSPDQGTPRESPMAPLTKPVLIGVGNFGVRWVTRDGIKWDKLGGTGSGNPHTPDLLREIDYGDGIFVAVGGNKNMGILRSADGGKTWQDVGAKTGGWLGGVAFHKGIWFACSGGGTKFHRSDDKGITWKPVDMSKSTKLTPRPSGGLRGMASFDGKLVAFGDKGSVLLSTDDGATWTNRSPSGITHSFGQAGYIAKQWYFAGFSIIDKKSVAGCRTTKDFNAWKPCPFPFKQGNNIIASGGRLNVFFGTSFQYTTDGNTWTKGQTVVSAAYKAGREWWGFRWNGVHVGPDLANMKKVNSLRPSARDWVLGLTR